MGEDTKRLHEYRLEERPIKMNRKWVAGIAIGLTLFFAIVIAVGAVIFMTRRGLL